MIDIDSVSFRYDDGPRVLEDLSVEIERGDTVALMGPNGSGKTTLLKLIAGLLEPDSGTIAVAGDDDAVVGLAPENPDDGLFANTVREEVGFFPRNRGLAVEHRVDMALERFDIETIADRTPQTLSQGEKRLVTLAAVFAGDPDVIALDEPTSGLDTPATASFGDHLQTLDRTVVVATHDATFAWRAVDTVIVLEAGRIHRTGPTRQVLGVGSLDFDALGLREPGPVRWARTNGFDRVPAGPAEAAEWLSGGSP